jgi:hypothetical protein
VYKISKENNLKLQKKKERRPKELSKEALRYMVNQFEKSKIQNLSAGQEILKKSLRSTIQSLQ